MKRASRARVYNRLVHPDEVVPGSPQLERLVAACNRLGGAPLVLWDPKRGGYGLFAERDYAVGEKVTEYGGIPYPASTNRTGDYVALMGKDTLVDGRYGFRLGQEQGRWINESDAQRSIVNVELGRVVRVIRPVAEGEQFFGDYGPDYDRSHY